jgi:hypothetical protein
MQLMSATACRPKTFNNCLSFERDFWQPKIGRFSVVPKRRVFGAAVEWPDGSNFRCSYCNVPLAKRIGKRRFASF